MKPAGSADGLRDDCLARLRELSFVKGAAVRQHGVGEPAPDMLVLRTTLGQRLLRLIEVRSHLTQATARGLGSQRSRRGHAVLLFAPHVSREMGHRLAEAGLQYVDRAGNCSLSLDGGLVAHVEGRRATADAAAADRTLRAPSLQVLFAWLARADLLDAPVREVAAAAGVSRSTVSNLRRQLEAEGSIVRTARGRVLARASTLRDRWLAAYPTSLRPHLLQGRYEVATRDPLVLERGMEKLLRRRAGGWAWGGGSAAHRLARHWHGERTTLHVSTPPHDLLAELAAVPSRDGRLVVLATPGPLGLDGPEPHVAHPLLVVAELLSLDDERATEAAVEIVERHLDGERPT